MSFGMGKRLKYLKIRGQLLHTGEPDVDDPDVRVYRAVTLKDDDAGGQEVHFRVMFIPRRLEDALEANDWRGTFYVLRHLDGQGLVGALYAAEVNGQKVYEPTGGWKALKFMTAVSSRRRHCGPSGWPCWPVRRPIWSCTSAVRAFPPASTWWPGKSPACPVPGCTPVRGASGAPTRDGRSPVEIGVWCRLF